jgi:hypothetical protein
MKRNLSLLLAGLLVLVMASPLYAAPDIKVTGQIRTRLRYWVDIDLDSNITTAGGAAADRRYFDNRTRLGVDAKLSDGVRAVIQLEKYFDFGNTSPSSAQAPFSGATPGNSAQDPYIRQAYFDFAIPGLQEEGWRIQAGRSFFRVGHGFIWGNSLTGEDGFTLYGPIGPGNFKGRFAMTRNASPAAPAGRGKFGDNELFHWAADYKFDVAEKQNIELYVVGEIDRGVDAFSFGVQNTAGLPVRHADQYWFGAAYTGVAGPVALKAEGTYQFGTARRNACLTALGGISPGLGTCATPNQDIDRSAFFAYGEGTYKITPAASVGLSVTFATGDGDALTDDTFNNFVAPLAEWTSSPTRVWTDSQFFHGNRTGRAVGNIVTNRNFNFWGRGTLDPDTAGATLDDGLGLLSPGLIDVTLKGKYAFNKQVTGLLNIAMLWAPSTGGESVAGIPGISTDSYLGTEVDGKIAYKPYKNLVLNGYFGVFFPGGYFEPGGLLGLAQAGTQASDTAWLFRTEAIVTF